MKMFMNQIGTPPYTVYVKGSIKSVKDLKGKKVIVGGPRDVTRYYIETLFKKEELAPGSYDYIYAGATSTASRLWFRAALMLRFCCRR